MTTKERVVIVVCTLWLVIVLSQNRWWMEYYRARGAVEDVLLWGILPVAVVLGYLWVTRSKESESPPEE